MGLKFVGNPPFGDDGAGKPPFRIATFFPDTSTLITIPGIHATQCLAYVDLVNAERVESGLAKLTREEEDIKLLKLQMYKCINLDIYII